MGNMKDSGIEWIGMIPTEWDLFKVKHLFKIGRGRVISELELDDDGLYPVYSSQTKDNGCLGYINTYDFDIDQLTWTTDGVYAGTVFIRHGKHNCTNVCGTLQPLSDKNNLEYMKYALEFIATYHKRPDTNGAKIMNNEMAEIKITLPPLKEQQLIADFLDDKVGKIDDILSDLRKQVETLQKYKKSVITKAVTKGLDSSVTMKDSGVEWIGEIPKSWDTTKRIKDIFNIGKGLSITKENLIEEGISVISYGQVHSKENTGTYIKPNLIRYVSDDYLKKNKNCLVHKGDFIFADTSEDVAGCGNCVYVDYEDIIFAGYHTIILSSDISDNRYLAYLFNTDAWRCQIREKVTAVKVYTISQKILKECKIILPSETEQQEIADYLDDKCAKIDELIKDKEAQIEKMEKYKKSLIYEYVTGKKRVKGAE